MVVFKEFICIQEVERSLVSVFRTVRENVLKLNKNSIFIIPWWFKETCKFSVSNTSPSLNFCVLRYDFSESGYV